ncbi:uncharacterized protein EI97DRAFT_480920 [Westerdykella ornata]|uniref:Required for respiratory growth protein 9, mitochondrial n=1 Tax=Westerdykella ornata TaxID=318751 RepID=A0A6A6JAI2_WESOR|nr:uncharacterized protein EI97DRAFT_480920 [Westerdykella ornata]KAF2273267.1 hypothetical protein EI97DRAFT_480920 [Westerdykella ornata]
MNCANCARTTLRLFIRSLTRADPILPPRLPLPHRTHVAHFSTSPRCKKLPTEAKAEKLNEKDQAKKATESEKKKKEPEPWQVHKAAIKKKLNGEAWNPRKKLSPDTMEGIRHLHQTQPQKFTTPVLAQYFKVSPEAIRRILKSKWRPSDEEAEERLRRWDKRGERIWSNLVEMGVKPPKKWREMGVGKAQPGQKPRWKTGRRNMVPVNDNIRREREIFKDDLIPIVDGRTGAPISPRHTTMADRLL